jgi:hypothetical protein
LPTAVFNGVGLGVAVAGARSILLNIIIGTGGFAGGGATAVGLADDADSVVGGGLIIVYFCVAGADGATAVGFAAIEDGIAVGAAAIEDGIAVSANTALSSSGTRCLGATRGALVAY